MKLLLSIVFIVILNYVEAQDPEITEIILPEIKRVGLSGTLKCVVINQMDNPVYWIQKETMMHISKDDKIELDDALNKVDNGLPKYEVFRDVMGDKITYTLTINRLERRDSGYYTCQILVRGDTEHPSKDGQIVVLVPPSVIYTSASKGITVQAGQSFNLTCDADGYPMPNVTWVRINGGVLPNGKIRHQGRLFPIENVKTSDRGIFRCLADNAVRPPAVFDTTVEVYFKPESNSIQSSYGQAENRMFDVTIECRIAGWPEPDLHWYKEDLQNPISNNDKFTVNILLNHANVLSTHERWLQLVIRSVTANDFGNYLCQGINMYGEHYAIVRLFPTSECQGPNCPEEQEPGDRNNLAVTASAKWMVSLPITFIVYSVFTLQIM